MKSFIAQLSESFVLSALRLIVLLAVVITQAPHVARSVRSVIRRYRNRNRPPVWIALAALLVSLGPACSTTHNGQYRGRLTVSPTPPWLDVAVWATVPTTQPQEKP